MKLTIGEFEVEVKAKYKGQKRSNKEATGLFLNEVSMIYKMAAEWNKRIGCGAFENDYHKKWDETYKQLKGAGFYD